MDRETVTVYCGVCGEQFELLQIAGKKIETYDICHEINAQHIVSTIYVPGLMCKSAGLCE